MRGPAMIRTQRPLDELHAPKGYFNRRIKGSKDTKITAEDYLELGRRLDEQEAIEANDADHTKVNITGIHGKWIEYEDSHLA